MKALDILFYKIYSHKTKLLNYLPLIILAVMLQLYLHSYGRVCDYMSLTSYAIMLSVFCLLFVLFIYGKVGFLKHKIMSFFGEISYSLYLVHQALIYGFIIPLLVDEYGYDFWTVVLLIAIPFSILLATGFTYLIEIPLRNYLKKRFLESDHKSNDRSNNKREQTDNKLTIALQA